MCPFVGIRAKKCMCTKMRMVRSIQFPTVLYEFLHRFVVCNDCTILCFLVLVVVLREEIVQRNDADIVVVVMHIRAADVRNHTLRNAFVVSFESRCRRHPFLVNLLQHLKLPCFSLIHVIQVCLRSESQRLLLLDKANKFKNIGYFISKKASQDLSTTG